jgi:hypothetical protein
MKPNRFVEYLARIAEAAPPVPVRYKSEIESPEQIQRLDRLLSPLRHS